LNTLRDGSIYSPSSSRAINRNNQVPTDSPPPSKISQTQTQNTGQKTESASSQPLSELPANRSDFPSLPENTKTLTEVQAKTEISSALEPELKALEAPKIESESVKL
jgi:hypothetical protein